MRPYVKPFSESPIITRIPTALIPPFRSAHPSRQIMRGTSYFGYLSSGAALPGFPSGIPSGLARISWDGHGKFVSAAKLANNPAYNQIVTNCAPAVNGATVYVTVSTGYYGNGYLCSADSATLTPTNRVLLVDPLSKRGPL